MNCTWDSSEMYQVPSNLSIKVDGGRMGSFSFSVKQLTPPGRTERPCYLRLAPTRVPLV